MYFCTLVAVSGVAGCDSETRLAFTLMTPASLISVSRSSTWVQFTITITRLSLMLMSISEWIASATAAFGALKNIFTDKYLSEELKGEVYEALILRTLLYGCEAWSLREDLFKRLRSFHNKCARCMGTSNSLFRRMGLLGIGSYFYNRFLRWAGHVARIPMSRAPQQLLTSCRRPVMLYIHITT